MVKDESEFNKNVSNKDGLESWCKVCKREANKKNYNSNRERRIEYGRQSSYRHGVKPMSENKECTAYLGCYINERILKHVMPNAVLMDNNNPGYDLVCGKGYLVDAKASVTRYEKNKGPYWSFNINLNKTPDYFLLTAYKDRESLEICHMWLIPGDAINDKTKASISLSRIHKWDQYKINHTEALSCAMQLKASA
jgi:hypothetical protein